MRDFKTFFFKSRRTILNRVVWTRVVWTRVVWTRVVFLLVFQIINRGFKSRTRIGDKIIIVHEYRLLNLPPEYISCQYCYGCNPYFVCGFKFCDVWSCGARLGSAFFVEIKEGKNLLKVRLWRTTGLVRLRWAVWPMRFLFIIVYRCHIINVNETFCQKDEYFQEWIDLFRIKILMYLFR